MNGLFTKWIKQLSCAVILLTPVCCACIANAQTPDTAGVKNLLTAVNNYNSKFTPEKLYLHFDKPYYAVGDTIWFKAYLLNAASRNASAYSNKIYVELLNDSSKVLQTLVLPVTAGLAQGDLTIGADFREGAYSIRAYTNWMQNFGLQSFFHQRFYIGKPDDNSWLISEQHQTNLTATGRRVNVGMVIKNAKGRPLVNQTVVLHVLQGKKGFLKSELQTDVDGKLHTDFLLPDKINTHQLSLLLEDKTGKNKKMAFPFYPDAGTDIDLQFMPEGGSLVAGLYNRVGFKAIGEDGLGIAVEGRITNIKNEEVVTFKSMHNGMGNLALIPVAGDTYTAKIKLPGGLEKSYIFPIAKPSGVVLRVDAVSNPDTVRLYITGTADKTGSAYTLLARGNGVSYFGTPLKLNGGFFNTKVPKNKFPGGIVNFTLVDAAGKTVNARNVFIDRHDKLNIGMGTDKPVYATTDSIALNFKVTDQNNSPIQASFSVSVTDDSQVKDAQRYQHILSYFLLSSELKGHIEDPDWYFDSGNASASKALDNLLMTQGWIGFNVEKATVKNIPQPLFWAEADNGVEGKLTNFFNKPAANRQVILMSTRNGLFMLNTVSNANGEFAFHDLPFNDTTRYAIKIHKASGAEAAVGITVKEFKPAAPPLPDTLRLMPWYANTDTTLLNYLKSNQKRVAQLLDTIDAKGRLLQEVKIKGLKKASLQGVGGEDVYFADEDLSEKDMVKDGNISLLTYMFKNLKGFHTRPVGGSTLLYEKAAMVRNIIIDNISIFKYYEPTQGSDLLNFMTGMLDRIPAAAVKNLVIYHNSNGKTWFSYIIIKTRSGNGPVLKETPGLYVYRPLPLYLPRDFYRPLYNVKNPQPDLRSTIYWEPNLVTDEKGNAKLSFYAADKPGTYTVAIEGTDMQGHFGVSTQKITIAPGSTAQ